MAPPCHHLTTSLHTFQEKWKRNIILSCLNHFFFFFRLSRATPEAYGGCKFPGEPCLPAYAIATAMPDPSRICDLQHSYHSSQQCWILNPLGEARDGTRNLTVPSQIRFRCTMMGTLLIHWIFLHDKDSWWLLDPCLYSVTQQTFESWQRYKVPMLDAFL